MIYHVEPLAETITERCLRHLAPLEVRQVQQVQQVHSRDISHFSKRVDARITAACRRDGMATGFADWAGRASGGCRAPDATAKPG